MPSLKGAMRVLGGGRLTQAARLILAFRVTQAVVPRKLGCHHNVGIGRVAALARVVHNSAMRQPPPWATLLIAPFNCPTRRWMNQVSLWLSTAIRFRHPLFGMLTLAPPRTLTVGPLTTQLNRPVLSWAQHCVNKCKCWATCPSLYLPAAA